MLVLAVLGLIFSLGAVKMSSSLPRYRLRTAAREIGTAVEETRLHAISRGSWTGVRYHLDPDKPAYELLPPAPTDYPNEPISERESLEIIYFDHPDKERAKFPGLRIVRVSMRGTGEEFSDGVVDVYFSPTGTEGSHIVTLASIEGGFYTLTFNALTGTVDFFAQEDVLFEDFED